MTGIHKAGWTLVLCAVLCSTAAAAHESMQFGAHDVRSVFHVRKSQNNNQVHYGIRLDEACRPMGERPVYAYWVKLEHGPHDKRPLTGAATMVYAASDKQKVVRRDTGGWVAMYVKAVDDVWVSIDVQKRPDGQCKATPTVEINGDRSVLEYAFVQLRKWNLGVKHVDLIGRRVRDGKRVRQRLDN